MLRETPCDILVKEIKEKYPNSLIFKIENFSLLKKYHIKEVESSVFTHFGRKWKLILYPDGNEKENGNGHVSLYLEFQGSEELVASFQFSVENQVKHTVTSQEEVVGFDRTNNKWCTAKLISMNIPNDSKEEYLMGDCSIFTVYFSRFPGSKPSTAETFSLVELHPPRNRVTWKMEKFSAFNPETDHMSHEFTMGNRKWRLQVFPGGQLNAKGKYISVYLMAKGFTENTPKTKTYAKYALRVLNQKEGRHRIKTAVPSTDGTVPRRLHKIVGLGTRLMRRYRTRSRACISHLLCVCLDQRRAFSRVNRLHQTTCWRIEQQSFVSDTAANISSCVVTP